MQNLTRFLERYGGPLIRRFQDAAAGTILANRDPERYLLLIYAFGGAPMVRPGEVLPGVTNGVTLSGTDPLDLYWGHYGTYLSEQWWVSLGIVPSEIVVVECFARNLPLFPGGIDLERSTNPNPINRGNPGGSVSYRPGTELATNRVDPDTKLSTGLFPRFRSTRRIGYRNRT